MSLKRLLHIDKKPWCKGQKNSWRLFMLIMPLLLPILLLAQTAKQVTGTITDEKGNLLSNVSVVLKGTGNGVKTDASGKFTISAKIGTVLQVSFTGYETGQITIGEKNNYTLSLKEKVGELSDVTVVNIGYGSVKRKDLTGAVGSVDMKDLQKAPVRSFDEALAGALLAYL